MRSKFSEAIIGLIIFLILSSEAFAWQQPPVAAFYRLPSETIVGEAVYFKCVSYDPDGGNIVSREWDFGEGAGFQTGSQYMSHVYNPSVTPQTYTVKLRVTDNEGSKTTTERTVIVYERTGPFYVDRSVTDLDPEDGIGDGSGPAGESWDTAYKRLSDAIEQLDPGAEIRVAEGIYTPDEINKNRSKSFILKEYMEIYGGYPSGGEESDPLAYPTILSGDLNGDDDITGDTSDNSYRIVKGAHGIVLSGFTITKAWGQSGSYGGGMNALWGDMYICNCIFIDNLATYGGGIHIGDNTMHPTLKEFENCFFIGNDSYTGGAVSAAAFEGQEQTFINCVFANNSAQNGAGIYNKSETSVFNCTFSNNEAGVNGGGVYNTGTNSLFSVKNCILWGNTDGNEGTTTEQEQIYDDDSDVTVDYSCIEGFGSLGGTGNIDDEPHFVGSDNPNGSDGRFYTIDDGLHLQRISLCIDAGDDSVDAAEDILGISRVDIPEVGDSSIYDMGAYEVGRVIFVDANATGSNDGTSWTDAYNYLRDALNNSQAGDEIWVADGTYYPDEDAAEPNGTDEPNASFELVGKVAVYGGFAGDEESLFERNLEQCKSILSGDIDAEDIESLPEGETIYSGNSYHVVTGADDALLDGFTVTEGYIGEANIPGGAGVYCDGTSPVIKNCIITNNFAKADSFGGGIYAAGASSLKLFNCLVAGNFAQKEHCGGIYQSGTGTLELINCTVVDNAFDGIHCDGATLNIYNSIIWHNRIDPNDSNEFPVREIVLNDAQANIHYSNVEQGQAGINISSSTLDTDLPDDNTSDPEFESWGAWKWKLANGTSVQIGTSFEAKADEITIYDLKRNFADVERGSDHHEDDFIQDMLDTNPNSPTYKKPIWQQQPGETSTVSNADNFNLWFNDDPNSDKSGPIRTNKNVPSWICIDEDDGVFKLDSYHFFPIDNWCDDPNYGCGGDSDCLRFCSSQQEFTCEYGAHCTEHAGSFSCDYNDCTDEHNYFFTLQYHTKCRYVPGQILRFLSSDDLFVAINDALVVNRAGYFVDCFSDTEILVENGDIYVYRHNYGDCYNDAQEKFFDLNLQPYEEYELDIFFAQRRRPLSVLVVERTPGDNEIVASFSIGDYHLTDDGQTPSPCIDAADSNALPVGINFDLDGNNRFIDEPNIANTGGGEPNFLDMGAYELSYKIPPVANDDNYIVGRNSELVVGAEDGVLANDYDGNGDEMTAELVEEAFYGDLSFNDDGSFTYEPPEDFYGTDDFQYRVKDSDGLYSDTATVTIDILYLQVFAGDDNDITIESNPLQMQLSEAYVLPEGTDVSWSVELEYLGTVDFVDGPNTVNPVIEITVDVDNMTDEEPAEFILWITAENEVDSVSDDIKITIRKGGIFQSGPYVEAGEYEAITLPYCNYVDLKGVVEDDGLPCGQIISQWSFVGTLEGDGTVEINDVNSLETRATFDKEGQYELRLWATDTNDSNEDFTVIEVNYDPAANHPPTAYAGLDGFVFLNGSQVDYQLSDACAVDLDVDALSILWTVDGPSGGASFNPVLEKPVITFTKLGYYTFTMLVSDEFDDDSDEVDIFVKPSLYVYAGANKSAALAEGGSIDIYFEDANAKKLTKPYDHLDIEWSLAVDSPNETGIDFNEQQGLENPTFTFTETGSFKLKLTAVDEDINETTNNSKSDIVWISIYEENPVEEKFREKVFVLPEFENQINTNIGRLGFLSYYPEDDEDEIIYDEELVFSHSENGTYYNTIDMKFDTESGYLFISSKLYDEGEVYGIIYVNEAAREFVFDETKLSEQFIPTEHLVGGIAFDNTKSQPKLYVLENHTATSSFSHNLFVYIWDADKKRLIFEELVPLGFDANYPEASSQELLRRQDLAFDNKSGILYVTFGSAQEFSEGIIDVVYGYDTNDWSIERRIETAESGDYYAYFIDAYNDGEYTYLYTADWDGSDLARTKIDNINGDVVDEGRVKKSIDIYDVNSIFGLTVFLVLVSMSIQVTFG